MTIVPGFIDCHNHAGGTTLLYEVLVGNPFEVEFVTIASIVDKLRAKARQTPPGTWVEGYFFDDTKLKDKRAAQRARSRRGVDAIIRSSCAIAAATRRSTTARRSSWRGVTKDTPNPPGGTFDRDAERRAQRPRHRSRAQRVQSRRHAADVHAEQQRDSAIATASRTSRSSSSATASPACITRAATSPRCRRCARAATCTIA